MRLVQETRFPDEEGTTLTVRAPRPARFALRVRVPYWATSEGAARAQRAAARRLRRAGRVLRARAHLEGRRPLQVTLPMRLHIHAMPDDPDAAGGHVRAAGAGRTTRHGGADPRRPARRAHPAAHRARIQERAGGGAGAGGAWHRSRRLDRAQRPCRAHSSSGPPARCGTSRWSPSTRFSTSGTPSIGRSRRRDTGPDEAGRAHRPAWVRAVLAVATLAPFHFAATAESLARGLANVFIFRYSAATAVDAVQNVLLFAGWGALWVTTSRPLPLAASIRGPALTGAAMSVMAETLQLFLPDRHASILDVMTNTAGAALGAASIAIAVQTARAMRTQKSYVGLPAAGFAIAYLCATVAEAALPLQSAAVLAARSGNQLHRMHAAVTRLDWSSLWHVPLADVVLFFPLGVFGVMAWSRWARGIGPPSGGRARGERFGSILIEVSHGSLGQPIQLGAAAAHIIGIVLGRRGVRRMAPEFLAPRAGTRAARRPAGGVRPAHRLLGLAAVRDRDRPRDDSAAVRAGTASTAPGARQPQRHFERGGYRQAVLSLLPARRAARGLAAGAAWRAGVLLPGRLSRHHHGSRRRASSSAGSSMAPIW